MSTPLPPNFTGFHEGVFYVTGTPSKRLVEWAESMKLVRFPTFAARHWCVGTGPRPVSAFDLLPDEPAENTTA